MSVAKSTLLTAGLTLFAGLALMAGPKVAAAEPAKLTIYTYDSFVTEWGPGPKLKEDFEKLCNCTLDFVAPGDATETFNRLRLEGSNTKADILLGLDSNLIADAEKSGLFEAHGLASDDLKLPVAWDASTYLPFDWGYFAFIYDETRLDTPPKSFQDLIDAPEDLTILIQDPRSSTPGLGLLLWIKQVYGEKAGEVWQKLAPRIVTVTKGWSEAYGMFLEGQSQMVLSYTTSPAYHIAAENKTNYKAAKFSDGHYMQIELAAMLKSSEQKELARQFLAYLKSPEAQAIIPTTNWMYPVGLKTDQWPKAFKELIKPEKALLIDPLDVPAARKAALDEWLTALSR